MYILRAQEVALKRCASLCVFTSQPACLSYAVFYIDVFCDFPVLARVSQYPLVWFLVPPEFLSLMLIWVISVWFLISWALLTWFYNSFNVPLFSHCVRSGPLETYLSSSTDFSVLFMVISIQTLAGSILEDIICQEGDIFYISPQCISLYRWEEDFLYNKGCLAICFLYLWKAI